MAGKAEALQASIGGNMAESMGAGVRLHSSAKTPEAQAVADRRAGVKRLREAGYIELSKITPDPAQVRKEFSESSIKQLGASLKKFGVLQPIQVRWSQELSKYVIVSGERRYRAAMLIELESLPCVFGDEEMSESEKKQRQLTENCLREDLSSIEQAHAFKELMDLNSWNGQQLAEALCLSNSHVSQSLAVLSLPADIQEKVEEGVISGAAAYEVSRLPDETSKREVAEKIQSENLSREETREVVRKKKGKTSAKPKARPTTEKKFVTSKATVSLKFKKKNVTYGDILAALEEATKLHLDSKKAAA